MSRSAEPPLGPLSSLPAHCEDLKRLRILLLVTSVNSFTQRILSYLQYLGFEYVSVQLATSDEAMIQAAEAWETDVILCPFLTKKLPESIHQRWITLVVHPGPPGDAGPSSLDWVLLGDDGSIPDPSDALSHLLTQNTATTPVAQRTHWGTICFQATETLDGGAVWAWEQYSLPPLGSITKAQLYQGYHSSAAVSAVIHALCRVYEQTIGAGLARSEWLTASPKKEWSTTCVSLNEAFLGGPTFDRPLLQAAKRRPDWTSHTAHDVLRILNAGDSQPGAMLHPLTGDSKSSLFAYGAHVHEDPRTVPTELYMTRGYESYDAIPDGTVLATRQGAVFIKTRQGESRASGSEGGIGARAGAGIWITHGRVPRGKDKPIDPKIPMVEAIRAAGHVSALDGVQEWEQDGWEKKEGEWQEVYVRNVQEGDGMAQLVYWDFYNGAFTTENCKTLLKALQWAMDEARGNVKLLALMGGNYFSNGIALNTIEHATSPGQETWNNINAIDDIVSFLVGDTHAEVPDFLKGVTPLCERGIVTVACVRGNAAAGGVALATACDVVLAARGAVLNPSYRGMGLHGSELHSFTYLKRCGPRHAAAILRDMKPLNTDLAHSFGLIDMQVGTSSQTVAETEPFFVDSLKDILAGTSDLIMLPNTEFRCAPWSTYNSVQKGASPPRSVLPLVQFMCENKALAFRYRDFPPLLHYRNEELSQMLLDSFHPVRSERYHSRRYNFIRKIKASSTPARYAHHSDGPGEPRCLDPEDTPEFDDAPGWARGEEWSWVGLPAPESLNTSEKTRIDLWYRSPTATPRTISCASAGAATPTTVASPLPLPSPGLQEASDGALSGEEQSNALGLVGHASAPAPAVLAPTPTHTFINHSQASVNRPGLTPASSSSTNATSIPRTPKEGSKLLALFGTIRKSKDKSKSSAHQSTGEVTGKDDTAQRVWTADEFGELNPVTSRRGESKDKERRYSTVSKAPTRTKHEKEESKFRSLRKRVKSVFKTSTSSANLHTVNSSSGPPPPLLLSDIVPATPLPGVERAPTSPADEKGLSTPTRALKALRRLSLVASPSRDSDRVKLTPSPARSPIALPTTTTTDTIADPIQSATASPLSITATLPPPAPATNDSTTAHTSTAIATPRKTIQNPTIRGKRISPPQVLSLSPSERPHSPTLTPGSIHSTPEKDGSLGAGRDGLDTDDANGMKKAGEGGECEYPCLVDGGEQWESSRKAPLPPSAIVVDL